MMGTVCPGASPLSGRVIAGAGPVCQGNEAEVRDSRERTLPPQGTGEGGVRWVGGGVHLTGISSQALSKQSQMSLGVGGCRLFPNPPSFASLSFSVEKTLACAKSKSKQGKSTP